MASLVFVSCSQTKEFTIPTMSGTKIYSPNGVEMNVEKTDCLTKVKIKKNKFLDKTYCAYLLSYDDSTKMLVPFGMDYTLVPKSRAVWRNVGYCFCTAGIATFSVGFIGSLLGNVTNASWLHDGGKYSTCTVENPHIINSIYFRSIIKENDFNGKDQDRIYSNNYHSRW